MCSVMQSLQTLSFFKQHLIVAVEEITSGLSQRSFKVSCDNHQCFYAKYFNDDNSEYAQIEKEVLQNSTSTEITMPLLYSDQQWIITPFIQANDLSEIELPITNKLYIALDLMLTFQQIKIQSVNIKPISFIAHGDFYVRSLALNEQQQHILRSLLSDDESIKPESVVLCHGDLNFTNMLYDLRLNDNLSQPNANIIDFECCCYAEVEYEIAMLIAVNNLFNYAPIETIITDIKDYLHNKNMIISANKVMRYLFKSLLLNALWYLCRFHKTNDTKWEFLAQQQFQQADVFTKNQQKLASVFQCNTSTSNNTLLSK